MKHGRPHKVLKEQTYKARFAQGVEGYSTPYRALEDTPAPDEPTIDHAALDTPDAGEALTLATAVRGKSKHALKHALRGSPVPDDS